MGKLDIYITITNSTREMGERAIGEILASMANSAGPSGFGENWSWKANPRDEDETSGFGCAPTDVPDWLLDPRRMPQIIDGQRYERSDAIILAVRGCPAPMQDDGNPLLPAVARGIVEGMREALSPLTPHEPSTIGRAYLNQDASGDFASGYRVDIGRHPNAFQLRYVVAIEALYPGCTWHVHSLSQHAQAHDVEGRVVAVLMPTNDAARR